MDHAVLAWAGDIPIVTRCWAACILATSVVLSTGVVQLTDIVFIPQAVSKKWQTWRLLTPFFYFGSFDIQLIYSLYNITQHSRQLEEGFTSSWIYLWFISLNAVLLLLVASWSAQPVLLSFPLLDSLLYVWGRKNPETRFAILGVFSVPACYYALLCLGQSYLLRGTVGVSEISGLLVGHVIFYFDEVFAKVHGFNPLQAPWLWFQPRFVTLDQVEEVVVNEQEEVIEPEPAQVERVRRELEPDPIVEEIE